MLLLEIISHKQKIEPIKITTVLNNFSMEILFEYSKEINIKTPIIGIYPSSPIR